MAAVRDDLIVYWGVAAGSTHAALRRHFEGEPFYQDAPTPTHAMVNWRTENNQVWEGPRWMIDSGGAPDTILAHGGHPDTVHDYLDYIRNPPIKYGDDPDGVDIEQFALRDWPCEPAVRDALGLNTIDLQHRTLVDHINMMNAIEDDPPGPEPVCVLQGWDVEDYLRSIDLYREHGVLTDRVGIGTLCGRDQVQTIRTIAWRIKRNLPPRCSLHGFGVKGPALGTPDALRIFDSIDTLAWDQSIRHATMDGVETGPPGGDYEDWADWDERGNPRYTAKNLWLNYRAYAERLAAIEPVETPRDMTVVTLDQLFDIVGEERPEGVRADEYIVFECVCGQLVDPGRPDPTFGPPQCRHCERGELDILDRRIMLEDELQAAGVDAIRG